MTEKLSEARGLLLIAFEAGRWMGEVDLEEQYDRDQCGMALAEAMVSRKTCMPCFPASTGRTVTVNLRSDRWREGVTKRMNEKLEELFERMEALFESEEYSEEHRDKPLFARAKGRR